jgi:5-methylcytosine-specific restriction endonuclease McrA
MAGMKKDPTKTPRSQIRSALRKLFLRNRERGFAIKRDKYTCQVCGKKQSRAKGKEVYVEVHHIDEIEEKWNLMIEAVYQYLLCRPDCLLTLCHGCHKTTHERESNVNAEKEAPENQRRTGRKAKNSESIKPAVAAGATRAKKQGRRTGKRHMPPERQSEDTGIGIAGDAGRY